MKRTGRRTALDMETVVGFTLLGGVLLSVSFIAAGLAWHWAVNGDLRLTYNLPATTVGGFIRDDVEQVAFSARRPRLLINVGIAILLLTPYVRVMASVISFAVEGNWKYVAFTAFVLATLTYSLFA